MTEALSTSETAGDVCETTRRKTSESCRLYAFGPTYYLNAHPLYVTYLMIDVILYFNASINPVDISISMMMLRIHCANFSNSYSWWLNDLALR